MSWVNGFYAWLFGGKSRLRPKEPGAAGGQSPDAAASADVSQNAAAHEAVRPSEETLYEHTPEGGLSRSRQHHWLFDEGVLHWNQRRLDSEFKPNFAGVNFIKEAAKTRLWGCPSDLAGDERVVLSGINLKFADVQGCNLARADLRHAKLQGANLRNANLSSVNFEGADLTDCDLRGAVLDGAVLARVRLVNANLTGASLKDANLAWADISHMTGSSKSLQDADLFGVVRRTYPADAVT
ncbi:MAG: pentapeptide repeat-containing protein [Micropepsaceae bacterium]